MTLEEAQQLRWSFNQTDSKLFIESADIPQRARWKLFAHCCTS
jgi:hypothetical protein